MQAQWQRADASIKVVSPVSLIVTAFARVGDVRRALTPQLRFDEGAERTAADRPRRRPQPPRRLGPGAGATAQLGDSAPDARRRGAPRGLLRGDPGAQRARACCSPTTTAPTAARSSPCSRWPSRRALRPRHRCSTAGRAMRAAALFAEELGAVVQVRDADVRAGARAARPPHGLGPLRPRRRAGRVEGETVRLRQRRPRARHLQSRRADRRLARDQPCDAAAARRSRLRRRGTRGAVRPSTTRASRRGWRFDPALDVAAPYIATGARPRVAILREQGVNGQVEMAAAFTRAGFDADDVHMSDLIEGRARLADYRGAGRLRRLLLRRRARRRARLGDLDPPSRRARRAVRSAIFADRARFALGRLQRLPDAGRAQGPDPRRAGLAALPAQPLRAVRGAPGRCSRSCDSPSLFLRGMAGSRIPVAVAHGEGRAAFDGPAGAVEGAGLRCATSTRTARPPSATLPIPTARPAGSPGSPTPTAGSRS